MISAIVAVDKNQGIGFQNQLPWPHLKEDMKWFKKTTSNAIVIMGSNTWKSLGYKPLPNRVNIVMSRTHDWSGDGRADHTFSDPEVALTFCEAEYLDTEIFVIGGSAIYREFKPFISRYFVTEIDESFSCDTYFDLDYVKKNFTKVIEHAKVNDILNFSIKEYRYETS